MTVEALAKDIFTQRETNRSKEDGDYRPQTWAGLAALDRLGKYDVTPKGEYFPCINCDAAMTLEQSIAEREHQNA